MTNRARQVIPCIPYSDDEPTLDMAVANAVEALPYFGPHDEDRAIRIAEHLDGGGTCDGLSMEDADVRAGLLLHIDGPLPDRIPNRLERC